MLGGMMIEMIQNADLSILHAIQGAASPAMDTLMVAFTTAGEYGAVWVLLAVAMIAAGKHRTYGFAILTAIALVVLFGEIGLKHLIARPRPFLLDPSLATTLVTLPDSYSCPSGHTASSFAAATVLCLTPLVHRWLKPVAAGAAGIIGFSRLYLCVHNPTDVLFGAVLGIVCGVAAVAIVKKVATVLQNRKAHS